MRGHPLTESSDGYFIISIQQCFSRVVHVPLEVVGDTGGDEMKIKKITKIWLKRKCKELKKAKVELGRFCRYLS